MAWRSIFLFALILTSLGVYGQDVGQITGDYQQNFSIYDRDSVIGTKTTQYFHEKSSDEAWLFLNYRRNDLLISVRYDMFHNSPLLNPQEAYTRQGIAYYSVTKSIGRLIITGGSFYDQFGSGIIFRAFEDRTIGLDYAIQGARIQYVSRNDSFRVKAFTGLQKYRFDYQPQVIKGALVERVWGGHGLRFVSGLGMTNRTLDRVTMEALAAEINSRNIESRFIPKYNNYALTAYNTLTAGPLSFYTEFAAKTDDPVFLTGANSTQVLSNSPGNVEYGVLNYAAQGLGVSLQYKRVDRFILRTSPYTQLLTGVYNYLPPLAKQHAYRLITRYSISALAEGEQGYQGEITYSPVEHSTFLFNTSRVVAPSGNLLYREYYLDWTRKYNRYSKSVFGVQSVLYDQQTYQAEPNSKVVHAFTPFLEYSHRLKRSITVPALKGSDKKTVSLKPSYRIELQYLSTRQDKGDFAYALLELNLAPYYSLSFSDMLNIRPVDKEGKPVNYYSAFIAYTYNQTRLTAAYTKQVEGVVCTGGVCRVEPAFSGFRFSLSTNF